MEKKLIIDLSSNTIEVFGKTYDIEAVNQSTLHKELESFSNEHWNLIYKPKPDKSSPFVAFFPLAINPIWFTKGRLQTQKHDLGKLLSRISAFDFCYEGNKKDFRITTSLENKNVYISGNCFSGEAVNLISPLVAWSENQIDSSIEINIVIDYLNKHGLVALLEFFKYLHSFSSSNVKVKIYYKDEDDKEGWEEYIDTVSSFEGVGIDEFVSIHPRHELKKL